VAAWLLSSRAKLTYNINQKLYIMSIATYRFFITMRFEHRGWTIELSLVGIHYPNYPIKNGEEAKAIWEYSLNGSKSCGTRTGNREDVLQELKKHIDWRIDDPDIIQVF
jgi:hypothetical protein